MEIATRVSDRDYKKGDHVIMLKGDRYKLFSEKEENTIFSPIMNRINPPAIPNLSSERCSSFRNIPPANRAMSMAASAKTDSRKMM